MKNPCETTTCQARINLLVLLCNEASMLSRITFDDIIMDFPNTIERDTILNQAFDVYFK